MPRFSTSITIDGRAVIINVPKGTAAWRKANAVFCPLGPAPTQAWFLMTKGSLDELDENAAHTVRWKQITRADDGSADVVTTLQFAGLYMVSAERLLHGGPGDANALFLVELADARLLAARNSDCGSIIANVRTFASNVDYLPETAQYTWHSLVEALWDACGLLGTFPGLPSGLPIDGVPDSTWLIGLNAWRALTAVLDQLDCGIVHNVPVMLNEDGTPIAEPDTTYSIVQLGASQTIAAAASTLQWNAEPLTMAASQAAATLNVYFYYHRQNYGQERDTEIDSNWAVNGAGDYTAISTGITGAVGTKAIWDDLKLVLDENSSPLNFSSIITRAGNRRDRYATRWTVENQHRIHYGLLGDFLPGGQIRATLWRNWDDGDSPLGGTVTEFICRSELVTGLRPNDNGPAWFDGQLGEPERENYIAPDLGRKSFPDYPRLPNVVQIWAQNAAAQTGDLIAANSEGLHPGRVKRFVNGSMTTLDTCLVLLLGYEGDLSPIGEHGRFYFGRLSGVAASGGAILPLYVCELGDQEFLGKRPSDLSKGSSGSFDLYHRSTESNSGLSMVAKALGHTIKANKWAIIARLRNGHVYASQYED